METKANAGRNLAAVNSEALPMNSSLNASVDATGSLGSQICQMCESKLSEVRVVATKIDGTILDSSFLCGACARYELPKIGFYVGDLK